MCGRRDIGMYAAINTYGVKATGNACVRASTGMRAAGCSGLTGGTWNAGTGAATPIATAFPISAIVILTTPIGAETAADQHAQYAAPIKVRPAASIRNRSRFQIGSGS